MNVKLKAIFPLLFPLLLYGCNNEEFIDPSIPIIDSYVFTALEYPDLQTSLSRMQPYVFNKGGYIDQLGPIINSKIDFNSLQSDTTTLLVYRHDVPYALNDKIIKVYNTIDGKIKVFVTYNLNKNDETYDDTYLNIICIKIPKIENLDTFCYAYAIRVNL